MMSAAAATPSSPKENSNGGSSDAASSASNIHPHLFLCDNLLNFSDFLCHRICSLSSETTACWINGIR